MAAIAMQESRMDPKAIGDDSRALGAFQIHSFWWDEFLEDRLGWELSRADYFNPDIAACAAEQIMEELYAKTSNLRLALRMYNGGSGGLNDPRTARYAEGVLGYYRIMKLD